MTPVRMCVPAVQVCDKHGRQTADRMDFRNWEKVYSKSIPRQVRMHGHSRAGEPSATSLKSVSCWHVARSRPSLFHPLLCLQRDQGSCGVFLAIFMDRLERGMDMNFSQKDIPLLRKRIALQLLAGSLMET